MSEPLHLDVYRERPQMVPLRAREHAPVCIWCAFKGPVVPAQGVHLSRCIRFMPHRWCREQNENDDCDSYRPSLWTRALQALRLRPFVERSRKRGGT